MCVCVCVWGLGLTFYRNKIIFSFRKQRATEAVTWPNSELWAARIGTGCSSHSQRQPILGPAWVCRGQLESESEFSRSKAHSKH